MGIIFSGVIKKIIPEANSLKISLQTMIYVLWTTNQTLICNIQQAPSLSLCHPSLFLDFKWSVCKDQHYSDHFPIVIKSNTSTVEDHNPKWKLNKANWELFQSLCTDTITLESFKDSSDLLSDFTSSLIDISSKCLPKTSTNPTKSNSWYNDECKEAIKTR